MRLSTRLLLLRAVFIVGLLASICSSFIILQKLKVNGPIFWKFVHGKDLVADILPPPENIVETHLTLKMLQYERDPVKKQDLVKTFDKLRKEYEIRHEFWKKELAQDEVKKLLVQDSYIPAATYYTVAKDSFIPAVMRGDSIASGEIMAKTLEPNYAAHRKQIDNLVVMVNKNNDLVKKGVTRSVKNYTVAFIVINGVILVLLVGIGVVLADDVISYVVGRGSGKSSRYNTKTDKRQ